MKRSLLLLTLATLAAPAAHAQRIGIELTADRTVLRPDGRSRATVTARVQNGNNPVPDGTVIRFTSTAGRLDADTAVTQGGIARVTLTAADIPGTARITANLDSGGTAVPTELTIQFSADADTDAPSQARRPWIHIKAPEFVGYAINVAGTRARLVGAFSKNGVSILTAGDLTIGADALQVDADRFTVRAVGNVILWRGKLSRTYAALRFDIPTGKGVAQTADGRTVSVEGRELVEAEASNVSPRVFEIVDQSLAENTIECREIDLEQGGAGRILMRQAKLYVGGQRIASLPFHTMTSNQRTLFKEQLVGLGPSGITLDLPFHFDVRPSALGTIHLRRGAQFGSSIYASRSGWTLDLDQAYERGGGQGLFQVLNMARPNRGLRLQHSQRFGAFTDGSLFVDSPNSRDLFGTLQLGHAFRQFRVSGFTSGTRTQFVSPDTGERQPVSGEQRSQFLIETYPRKVPGLPWVRFTLNANTQEQRFYGSQTSSVRQARSQALGTRLLTQPFRVAPKVLGTQSVVVGQTWTQGLGQEGLSLQGTTALVRSLGSLGNVQVNYDYLQTPALVTLSTLANPKHRIGVSTDLTNERGWNFNLYGAKGLDVNQTSLSAGLSAPLGGSWEVRTRLSDTQLAGSSFREVEYALVRQLDGRAVGIYYSTITRRIQLDLTGGLRF